MTIVKKSAKDVWLPSRYSFIMIFGNMILSLNFGNVASGKDFSKAQVFRNLQVTVPFASTSTMTSGG